MIGKGLFGRQFAGLLGYISEGGHRQRDRTGYMMHSGHRMGPVYYVNLAAQTPQAAAREMGFVARLSRRVEKPVFHLIISLHPDESKTGEPKETERIAQAAARVLAKLGLSGHQAAYAVHLEKNHMHCHVCVNRVRSDGRVWAMWKSAERIKSACRAVEQEMGYTPHAQLQARADSRRAKGLERESRSQFRPVPKAVTSGDVSRPLDWTTRQLRAYEKSGALPTRPAEGKAQRDRIADAFRAAVEPILREAESWSEAMNRLRKCGFEFAIFRNHSRRGLQLVGADGSCVAASAIHSEFSLLKLERRWGALSSCVLEEVSMERAGKAGPERSHAGMAGQMPTQVEHAHRELFDVYRRETASVVEKRIHLIADAKALESTEVAQLKSAALEELRELRMPSISREGRGFVRLRIQNDLRDAIQAVRSKYRHKCNSIREKYPAPSWIDFVVHKAKLMVQAAITILAWLRDHLDRRPIEHRLVPASPMRTPPEPFEHLGFKATVTDNGTIEYEDQLKRRAFADRGADIVVYTDEDGRPEKRHVAAALIHADAKWGGCSSPIEDRKGNFLFREFAASASLEFETYLVERFEAPITPQPAFYEKQPPGKPILAIKPVRESTRRR